MEKKQVEIMKLKSTIKTWLGAQQYIRTSRRKNQQTRNRLTEILQAEEQRGEKRIKKNEQNLEKSEISLSAPTHL